MSTFFIKTNRIFNPIRKYGWIFTLLVALGGLWYPRLGLFVIPIMISLATMAFFKGRYWCGNFCPHGSFFDSFLNSLSKNKNIPEFFKSNITISLVFLFFSFNLGRKFLRVSNIWGTIKFWDKLGFIFVASYLMVVIVGGILSIFISQRTWCNICPMGTLQRLSYKLGKFLGINRKTDEKITIASEEICHSCGKCARVCPMQLTPYTDFSDKNQFDNEVCIRCSTCVENCPAEVLSLVNEEEGLKASDQTSLEGYQNRRPITAKIDQIKELDKDTREYTFEFLNPNKIDYKAGQFILVKIQNNPDMYRAYSISSYNQDGKALSVTIKKVPDGYGTGIIFDNFNEGDTVELEGPMGNELSVDKNADKVLFVAGGIGITPFVPMVQNVVDNENNHSEVELIYGVNYEKDFLYDDHFSKMDKLDETFNYTKVVAFDENWDGKKGFVTDVIQDIDLDDYKIYMCGPGPMIDATMKTLDDMGVKEEDTFYESA